MVKIKLCGLSRPCDIEAVNMLKPDYIGFVFAPKSRRYVSQKKAKELKAQLDTNIKVVGVFVNETIEQVATLLNDKTIDIAQLHGSETDEYIKQLRELLTEKKPIIKAFRIDTEQDVRNAQKSSADFILLDSGTGGTGTVFEWKLIKNIQRDYFLAGGLDCENVRTAIQSLNPYGVDVSSGIETNGVKDRNKMAEFVTVVRKEGTR